LKIYSRLRPGNPPHFEKAKALFAEKFFDANRYRLGRVGRFRINRKFEQNVPEDVMTLRAEDILGSLKYIMESRVRARDTSTISTTWGIVVCARSTNWRWKSCARAS